MSRHISIAEIAAALGRPGTPAEALAMLKAYFDDSGTHGEALITAISGYLATSKQWEMTEQGWLSVLGDYHRYGVTWFHATDVARWDGEWRQVPLDVCRDAPQRFAKVLNKRNLMPVWAAVKNEDFYAYATPEFLAAFPTPFDLCFHEAMGQLYWWCQQSLSAMPILLFAAHGDYEARLLAKHREYLRDGDFAEYIGPITFDEPRRIVPLQAADLLANQFYNYWIETEYPTYPLTWVNHPILDLALGRDISARRGGCYAGEGMRAAVKRHADREKKRRSGGASGEG